MQIFRKKLDRFSCARTRTQKNEQERNEIIERFSNAVSNLKAPPPISNSHDW